MFDIVQPVTRVVKTPRQTRRKAQASQAPSEPTITFTRAQWDAYQNGMLAELLLQQDGADPRVLRSQWSAATQDDFDAGRARMRALLTDAGWTL